jgi:hypothetical protein
MELEEKMDNLILLAEKTWRDALDLLNGDCPKESCEWCRGR